MLHEAVLTWDGEVWCCGMQVQHLPYARQLLAVLPQVQASLMKNRLQAERDLVQATAVEAKPSKKRQPVTAQEGGAGTGG